MAIPYLDTLIANINSSFSGEVVELVVAVLVFNPALLPDDETLLRAYGNSKLSTLANFYGEKAEVTFEGVTYSCLLLLVSIKEEFLGEWQVFKKVVFQEKKVIMGKKHQPSIFAKHKRHHGNNFYLYISRNFRMINIFLALPIGTASVERSFSH